MGQRSATTAWQHLHAGAGAGHGGSRRHKDLGRDAPAGDEGDLVPALVCVLQQPQHGSLGVLHSVQSHGTAGIHDEDNKSASLPCHLLDPDVALFDIHVPQVLCLRPLVDGVLPAHLLEHHSIAEGGVQRNSSVLSLASLGQHGLDVSTPVHGVDLVAFATSAALLLLALELQQILVQNNAFWVDHELLRHLILLVVLLLVVAVLVLLLVVTLVLLLYFRLLLLLRFLLFLLLLLLLLLRGRFTFLLVVFWGLFFFLPRRRWWRLQLLIFFPTRCRSDSDSWHNRQLDALLKVFRVGQFPAIQGRMCPCDLHSENLATVTFAPAIAGFLRKPLVLLLGELDVIHELAGKQKLSLHPRDVCGRSLS
mmetsp:Transcript_23735/g.38080  ORF Transcript_23735/g.38080 Transcript_23735/m.38080 type:complete len:365 (-) Transcript_23735:1207-2301(-)